MFRDLVNKLGQWRFRFREFVLLVAAVLAYVAGPEKVTTQPTTAPTTKPVKGATTKPTKHAKPAAK